MQQAYWKRVPPWRVGDDAADRAAERFLDHDRPFSAIATLFDSTDTRPFSPSLSLRAMGAARQGTEERVDVIQSMEYVLGAMLDKLEQAGVDNTALADLEWFYLPVLDDQRRPRALYRRLAQEPEFFAELAATQYRHDNELGEADEDEPLTATAEADEGNGEPIDEAEVSPQVAQAAWTLLHGWRSPLPGTRAGTEVPDPADTAQWVTAARAGMAQRGRTRGASLAIGQALSGRVADPDGTWPSLPVREVLEREQDPRLERELVIGHTNQRGVTMRSPYAGGQQERELATKYRAWAEAVRDRWPRSGAVLDELARMYDLDALREDASAARNSEM